MFVSCGNGDRLGPSAPPLSPASWHQFAPGTCSNPLHGSLPSAALNAAGSNFGSCFVNLKDYSERRDPSVSADAIADRLRQQFGQEITDATVQVFGPPPVRGVGRAGGFALMIEDRSDLGPSVLQEETDKLSRQGSFPDREKTPWMLGPDGKPRILGMFSVFRANVPQYHVDLNTGACMLRGVNMKDFADTLSIYEGSLYVNDFNRFGRTWQVIVQAEADFRSRPKSIPQLRTRSNRGGMDPLGSLADHKEVNGPLVLTRYNTSPRSAWSGPAGP